MQHSTEPQAADTGQSVVHGGQRFNCERLFSAITDYLDGAMTPDDRERLEYHLSLCPPCQIYLDQIKVTIEATGRLQSGDVSPEAHAVLMALFRAWADGD